MTNSKILTLLICTIALILFIGFTIPLKYEYVDIASGAIKSKTKIFEITLFEKKNDEHEALPYLPAATPDWRVTRSGPLLLNLSRHHAYASARTDYITLYKSLVLLEISENDRSIVFEQFKKLLQLHASLRIDVLENENGSKIIATSRDDDIFVLYSKE